MAVRLRFKRMGKKARPFYRICAFDAHTRRDGRAIEELGYYNPFESDKVKKFDLKRERIEYWLSQGATPTEKVGHVLRKHGITKPVVEKAKA